MAKLFQTTQQNISQHIHNIYGEDELEPEATHKKFLSVRQEGSRQVQRNLDFYNLDMIIAKNYLNEEELSALNNLVEQYLIFAGLLDQGT